MTDFFPHYPAESGLALLLQLPGIWANSKFPDIVFAGGMPRSGTSLLESILKAHPQVVIAQEFMPLKNKNFSDMIGFITRTTANDRKMWVDDDGRHWRGFAESEDKIRMRSLIAACLLSTTSSESIIGKNLNEIRVLYCKTPSSEIYLPELFSALHDIEFKYVHSIREPLACLKSNWEMPWLDAIEVEPWIKGFAEFLGQSADAFERIHDIGVPTYVVSSQRIWSKATRLSSVRALLRFLAIDWIDEVAERAHERIDPWPPERRRQIPIRISESDEAFFLDQPGLKKWEQKFTKLL